MMSASETATPETEEVKEEPGHTGGAEVSATRSAAMIWLGSEMQSPSLLATYLHRQLMK